MVLHPIRIFAGSFGGPTLYYNGDYISPNEMRKIMKKKEKSEGYLKRAIANEEYKQKSTQLFAFPHDELDDEFKDTTIE